jgi:hypothetical protein
LADDIDELDRQEPHSYGVEKLLGILLHGSGFVSERVGPR